MGWSWPRGYFYRCPLPFPRAQCSHRDNPGPLHAQLQPGGLRTWHWSRGGRTGCPPCWAPRPSERGQRKPPELPREPPAPCTPLAASLDGELGPRLITETEEAPAGTKAQSSAPEPGLNRVSCPHPNSFLRCCCSGNGARGCVQHLPGHGSGAGRGWARTPVLTKMG